MLDRAKPVLVTGAGGMLGRNLLNILTQSGFKNVLAPTRNEVDLTNHTRVFDYFSDKKPFYVFILASKVGGIAANIKDPVGFMVENMKIQINTFEACHAFGVHKSIFTGSSCIYPRQCPQPMQEEYFLKGPFEPTNEGYAIAKAAGIKLAEFYRRQHGMNTIALIPCNLYGTNDHFDFAQAHVLSSLVRRFVDAADSGAPDVTVWGTGQARREFLHVKDAAEALLYFMDHYDEADFVNIGSGEDISIKELAALIRQKSGFEGNVRWDQTKPDGMPRKCMDVSKMKKCGFQPQIGLQEGIEMTIKEYKSLKAAAHK